MVRQHRVLWLLALVSWPSQTLREPCCEPGGLCNSEWDTCGNGTRLLGLADDSQSSAQVHLCDFSYKRHFSRECPLVDAARMQFFRIHG